MSSFLMDYPFADRLYPGRPARSLQRLRSLGPTVILSDGDVVFQPRKVEHAGLARVADGDVLIYIHKEEALDDVERRFPAEHYVLVDDKLRILDAVKQVWGERVTTVFPRQGQYAHDAKVVSALPPADVTIERIGDLLDYDLARLARRRHPCLQPEGDTMKPTQKLHDLGQSLWLDNITRELLNSGTLKRYIDDLSVTGLTSNPTIFDNAIKNSAMYDEDISRTASSARSGEDLFFDLALADLTRAADLFQPVFDADRRRGRLGVARGLAAAGARHRRAPWRRPSTSIGAPASPTSSSRFPARRKGCPPSRRRSSPACRSTSRCCSRASNTSRRPRPTCAASSGASPRG